MLRVVNTNKFSTWRNLKNVVQGGSREETPSSGYAFYQDETVVAEMTIFIAGNSQLNLSGTILVVKRYRSGFFTQEWGVEGNGQSLATAKASPLAWWGPRCKINYTNRGLARELTLRFNAWRLRGREIRVFEGESMIGSVERQGKEETIDLPEEVSLPVQLFIFKLAQILFELGVD